MSIIMITQSGMITRAAAVTPINMLVRLLSFAEVTLRLYVDVFFTSIVLRSVWSSIVDDTDMTRIWWTGDVVILSIPELDI